MVTIVYVKRFCSEWTSSLWCYASARKKNSATTLWIFLFTSNVDCDVLIGWSAMVLGSQEPGSSLVWSSWLQCISHSLHSCCFSLDCVLSLSLERLHCTLHCLCSCYVSLDCICLWETALYFTPCSCCVSLDCILSLTHCIVLYTILFMLC